MDSLKKMQLSTDAYAQRIAGTIPASESTFLVARLGTDTTKEILDGLINLVWHSSLHAEAVIRAGGVPLLVRLVNSGNCEHVHGSAWVLGNLSADSTKARDVCLAEGALPALLRALEHGPPPPVGTRPAIGWAINNLLRDDPRASMIVLGKAWPVLSRMLRNNHPMTTNANNREMEVTSCLRRLMRYRCDLTAAETLYMWWTPTWSDGRTPSVRRRAVVFTLFVLAERKRAAGLARAVLLPFMSSAMWTHVLGFLKHDVIMF
jgi:hypothetical protein